MDGRPKARTLIMDSIYELFHQLREVLNPKVIIETLLARGGIFVYIGLMFIVFANGSAGVLLARRFTLV